MVDDNTVFSYLWRVGRKLGRTIYAQLGSEPSDKDIFLGMMESKKLAFIVVEVHNKLYRLGVIND